MSRTEEGTVSATLFGPQAVPGLMHRAEVGGFGRLAVTLFCCAWQSFQAQRAGSLSAQGNALGTCGMTST